jgi:aromatic ring hydroxylase
MIEEPDELPAVKINDGEKFPNLYYPLYTASHEGHLLLIYEDHKVRVPWERVLYVYEDVEDSGVSRS